MNESLTNGEYISYTLHPHQQAMGYATLNGNGSGHQQQYGIMHTDLLQQAASGLLATDAPDAPLMMSQTPGGVLLTLNGTAMHNSNSSLHQSQQQQPGQQYSTANGTTVLVSANGNVQGATSLSSPQPNGGNGGQSAQQNSQRSSTNSNSTNSSSPPVHHQHSSKKKRKCH